MVVILKETFEKKGDKKNDNSFADISNLQTDKTQSHFFNKRQGLDIEAIIARGNQREQNETNIFENSFGQYHDLNNFIQKCFIGTIIGICLIIIIVISMVIYNLSN